MNRRTAVKGLLIFTGGVVLFPSCVTQEGKASIRLKHLDVTATQEKLLAEVAETIIPETDTAGAKQLGLHLFTLKMLDDLYPKKDQEEFMKGMEAFQKLTKEQMGDSFLELNAKQRQQVIAQVNAGKGSAEVLAFYKILKDETIKGYLNSELVMTKLRKYELVPGRYIAYHPIKSTPKIS